MPIHDWTRVRAGTFHHFHHAWITYLASALNRGVLPPNVFALSEQVANKPVPDLLALDFTRADAPDDVAGGLATLEHPPKAQIVAMAEMDVYARKANRIAIRHVDGDLVAILEIVSPGNKGSAHALRSFVAKTTECLDQGINVVVVDLLPPTRRDPHGIHGAVWGELNDEPFALPAGKSRTLASYAVGDAVTAYVEPLAVGDALPDLPLFLSPERYVRLPLEPTYAQAWADVPPPYRHRLEATE